MLALIGVTQFAAAQEAAVASQRPAATTTGSNAAPVVVVTGVDEVTRARNSAASKSVVTAQTLAKYGDINLTDALARVPGVRQEQGRLQIRGGTAQILVDGDRPPPGFTLSSVGIDSVERVEIYRVPSAEFSTQTAGGTINIILKKIAKESAGRARVTMENVHRPAAAVELQRSQMWGDLSASLGLMAQVRKGQLAAPMTTEYIEYDEQDVVSHSRSYSGGRSIHSTFSMTPRMQYKVNSTLSLALNSSLFANHSRMSTSEQFAALTGSPSLFGDTVRHSERAGGGASTRLEVVKRLPKGRFDAKVGMSVSESNSMSMTEAAAAIGRPGVIRNIEGESRTNNRDFAVKYATGTLKNHQAVTGVSGSRSESINHADTVEHGLDRVFRSRAAERRNSATENLAFFAQDEWDLSAGSSLYLGLRWEWLSVEASANNELARKSTASVWSPIVQGLWRLQDKASLVRLAASRTFQPPTPIMLLSPVERIVNNSPLSPRFRGNLALRPELAWSVDGSYEYAGKNEISGSLRTYMRVTRGLHRLQTFEQDGIWEVMYVNNGTGKSVGIEGDIRLPLRALVNDAPAITLALNASRVWSRIDYLPGPGNTLEPRVLDSSVGVDYQAKKVPLNAGFSFRFGAPHAQRLSLAERQFQPASRNLDAYASWRFDKKSQLRLSVNNILRPDSISRREYTLPTGAQHSIVSGRSWMLTRLTYQYSY